MRVLVLAGTGFIGGHVARAFSDQGDSVSALVRSRERGELDERLRGVCLVAGRLGKPPREALEGPFDVVVYAAGVWRRDAPLPQDVTEQCDEVYIRGVEAFAERALAWKAHFVFLSGISRYGDVAWRGPLGEDTAPGRLTIYGAHKRRSEAILAKLGGRGLAWTALVPPEVYGARDPGGYVRFVYERVRARRFVLLGDGENRWSLCNVHNVAEAAVHVARRGPAHVVHVADDRPSSQRDIAVAVNDALDRRSWFPRVPARAALAAARVNAWIPRPRGAPPPFSPAHVRVRTAEMVLDTTRARAIGFEPRHGLTEGVAEAVRDWEARSTQP